MKSLISRLMALSVLALSGTYAAQAQAATNVAGISFKAAHVGDAACFTLNPGNWAAVLNTCPTARELVVSLSVPEGWHNTSVSLYGSNSVCQTISTNGVGNGAQIGPETWTVAGPQTWQTLNTGSRYVWGWSPLLFRCVLEPNGIIGSATAE